MEEKRRTLKGMKGQYELLLPLARDRLADYFLGLNASVQGDDRFVVVREVLPEMSGDKERVSAFLSELRITSRFTHPNLVRTLETGRTKISYFAIEEFLLGEGLGRVLQASRAAGVEMAPWLAVGLVAQVCDGLEYAHQLRDSKGNPLQAIHRNLCPTHIVVCFSGRVKLLDFDVNETAFQLVDGVTRGDLAYLAPEQVERQGLSPAADIFALGTVLWELLAGRSLFRRGTDLETRQAVLAAQIPPLDRGRGVPGELEAVLARALQRNPRSRFQSAAQLGQALRDWLRQANKEVGEYEIGTFVRRVLGEQEKKKRRLLEQAVKAELASGDITSLVPDRKTRLSFEAPAVAGGGRPPTPPPGSKSQRPPSLPSLPPMPPPLQELEPVAKPPPPKVEPPSPPAPKSPPPKADAPAVEPPKAEA
ncbi:MAG TPA: serine/threonine-protein kinase, partial [Myxococcota bacterium]|nr:serine/threonine-protein kinase [Myxococcota bacterium]